MSRTTMKCAAMCEGGVILALARSLSVICDNHSDSKIIILLHPPSFQYIIKKGKRRAEAGRKICQVFC